MRLDRGSPRGMVDTVAGPRRGVVRASTPVVGAAVVVLAACAGPLGGGAAGLGAREIGSGPPCDLVWADLWPELTKTDGERPVKIDGATDESGRLRAWPVTPFDDQINARLVDAEAAYRTDDEDRFTAIRLELEAQPVAAFWLARFLCYVADKKRDRGGVPVISETGSTVDPWKRELDQLVAMGSAVVPFAVLDLVRVQDPFGPEILRRLGPAHVDEWSRLCRMRDERVRARAFELLTEIAADSPQGGIDARTFEDGLVDEFFGVRAVAYEGVAQVVANGTDRDSLDALLAGLRADPDPYVRRRIVQALARFRPQRSLATAIVDAWTRFVADGDQQGARAARASLERMSRVRLGPEIAAWRAYAESLPELPAEPAEDTSNRSGDGADSGAEETPPGSRRTL